MLVAVIEATRTGWRRTRLVVYAILPGHPDCRKCRKTGPILTASRPVVTDRRKFLRAGDCFCDDRAETRIVKVLRGWSGYERATHYSHRLRRLSPMAALAA